MDCYRACAGVSVQMAKVIRFPTKFALANAGVTDLGKGFTFRCLVALRMIADSIRSGQAHPHKMFVLYETCHGDETTWSYLSLGFEPDDLAKTTKRICDDLKDHPNPF